MTKRLAPALGSIAFFCAVPCVVAGLGPALVTDYEFESLPGAYAPLSVIGGALIVAGLIAVVHSFARFVVEGLGTPAPVAPTERLVVGGLYRYVRNPMYLAVAAVIVGQLLLFGNLGLLAYAAVYVAAVAAFVRFYEEPTLRRQFGEQYDLYRDHVPAWLPRRSAWRPPPASAV